LGEFVAKCLGAIDLVELVVGHPGDLAGIHADGDTTSAVFEPSKLLAICDLVLRHHAPETLTSPLDQSGGDAVLIRRRDVSLSNSTRPLGLTAGRAIYLSERRRHEDVRQVSEKIIDQQKGKGVACRDDDCGDRPRRSQRGPALSHTPQNKSSARGAAATTLSLPQFIRGRTLRPGRCRTSASSSALQAATI
jgi:hypothetical protein